MPDDPRGALSCDGKRYAVREDLFAYCLRDEPVLANNPSWYDPALFNATPVLARDATSGGYKGIVLKDKFGVSTVRNPKERYPWGFNESVSLARTFRFTERLAMELRGEAFNLFNRVQWQGPNTDISSNDFGRVFGQNNSPGRCNWQRRLSSNDPAVAGGNLKSTRDKRPP